MKQVIARYSALKLGAWVFAVSFVSISILAKGASSGWQSPDRINGWLLPVAAVISVLALITSAAFVLNFALTRGVAIARVNDEVVLYEPFRRRRISLEPGTTTDAEDHRVEGTGGRWPAVVRQVTVRRAGQANVVVRTGLLRESAETIAARLSALLS